MEPEELQEIGLFLLLGMVWAMLTRSSAGKLEPLVNVIIAGLFAAGIAIMAYGAILIKREGQLLPRGDGNKKG